MDNIEEEQHQELLNKLYNQVYKDLKKKMFPRKHVKLLYKDVRIYEQSMGYPALGQYFTEKVTNCKYTHHILISSNAIGAYENISCHKKFYKNRIKKIIAHELIHAYVYERYDGFGDVTGVHLDSSPMFLGILAYLDLPSGHKSWKSFKRTDLYKAVKACNNFDEVETLLIVSMLQHDKVARDLEYIIDGDKKTVFSNSYVFGNGEVTGVKGEMTKTFIDNGYVCKFNIFSIGPCVNLEELKSLTLRKVYNNSFQKKSYGKFECETAEDKKSKLHLQTLNI